MTLCACMSVAEHKRFVQLLDMRFKDINGYMNEMSNSIDRFLQVTDAQTHFCCLHLLQYFVPLCSVLPCTYTCNTLYTTCNTLYYL